MSRWYKFWRAIDAARSVPRILLGLTTWYVGKIGFWFMALEKPSAEQAAFVSLVSVAYAKMLDWYMQNGTKWEPPRGDDK